MPRKPPAVVNVAVVIPVGPEPQHVRWLDDCLKSVAAQTVAPSDVVIVDDMQGVQIPEETWHRELGIQRHTVYRPPWRLGVAHAFNHGSAVAFRSGADIALMLGADDLLEPDVIKAVAETYEKNGRAEGYYWCEVLYSDGRRDPLQRLPCNCAGWTPGFFKRTGGFPIESASGACDAAFISQFWRREPQVLMWVPGGNSARYLHRVHDHQQTRHQPPGLDDIRNWLTANYRDTRWGRYE